MEKRSPKTDAVIRENAYINVQNADFGDANFIGMCKEGAVFVDSNEVAFVVKITVKKENFEPYETVEEFENAIAEKKADADAKAKEKQARTNGKVKVVKKGEGA